ncbi:MAG: TonB-dependent receptor domain-containing protein [Vicinamibacterales bacterium]
MRLHRVLAAALLLTSAATLAVAQSTTGSIQGTVNDAQGGGVPGAAVTIRNVDTQLQRTTVTNESGNYDVQLLPPGEYALTAELAGFRTQQRTGVRLTVNQAARIDFKLEISTVEESVTVSAQTPLVETVDSAVRSVIDAEKLEELPLNGRNFRTLALIVPGVQNEVQGSTLSNRGGGVNINGAGLTDNNFLLDGFNNNDDTTAEILTFPSADAIQEMTVLGASYNASLGFAQGGIVSLVSKSGSQTYHGNGFGFFRDDAFDATNYFATTKPLVSRQQYGGSLGGPAGFRNAFFFGNYEKVRIREGVTLGNTVPTTAQRNGDFSGLGRSITDPLTGLPFSGNVIPASRLNPVGKGIADAFYPDPTNPNTTRNFIHSPELVQDLHLGTGRADWNPRASDSLMMRYQIYWDDQVNPNVAGTLPRLAETIIKKNQNLGMQWTKVWGPNTVQEVRVGWGRIRNARLSSDVEDWNARLGITGTTSETVKDRLTVGPPIVNVTGYSAIVPFSNPFIRIHNNWQYAYQLVQSRGDHSLRYGAEVRTTKIDLDDWNTPNGSFTFTGRYTGNAIADLLLGYPSQAQRLIGPGVSNLRSWQVAGFVQDEWRVTGRLSVNYGLRYEYQAPSWEDNNAWGAFVPALGRPVQVETEGLPRSIREFSKDNFAPRVGVVYDLSGDGTRTVRAGYGIYFQSQTNATLLANFQNAPTSQRQNFVASATAPNISMSDPFPAALAGTALQAQGFEPFWNLGRTERWSADIQQAIGGASAVTLGYVGSKSRYLPRNYNINQAVLGPGAAQSRRPFPQYGDITWNIGDGSGDYHSLQTKFERRMANGIATILAYTWQKAINNVSDGGAGDSGNQNAYARDERGLAGHDRAHRVTASAIYDFPFEHRLLRDWQVAGVLTLSSGQPFTPVLTIDRANIGSFSGQRPDRICSGALPADERSADRWFDTACFPLPAAGAFGNAGRNVLIAPGLQTLDTVLSRSFGFARRDLQVRFEAFNLLNHTNFLIPNRNADSPDFGKIFQAAPGRQIQLGVKFTF